MFDNLSTHLTNIIRNLSGNNRLTSENISAALNEVRAALLEADVSLPIVETFLANTKQLALGQEVLKSLRPKDAFIKVVYDEIVATLGQNSAAINLQSSRPVVIMLVGLQGCGKTTTVAKLAHFLKSSQKKSVLVTSTDIYRPAAIEQLRVLADKAVVHYFASQPDEDPVTIAKNTVNQAQKQLLDCVIIDTAGRLHIDTEMMTEIKNIYHAVQPTETLLVVDSMMGQDAINTAKNFMAFTPLTGVILTKADGDARGGAALSMKIATNQPIKFIGVGEKIDALEQFYPERIASLILGMGDILTLVDEAKRKIDQEKAHALAKKLQKGHSFDLEDFRTQLQEMRNLGGINNLISKLPNLGAVPKANNKINDQMFNKMEAIINSMTSKERRFPAFIRGSNKQRIAHGSGTTIQEINRLLKQFEQMQKMMGRFQGSKIKNMLKSMQRA